MAIDVATEATPAESAAPQIELGPDLSIYTKLPASAPDPSTSSTENAESETPVADPPEAEVSAEIQDETETPDADSPSSRREQTRLLKADEIEQIRSEERAKAEEALAKAAEAEATAKQLQESQAQQQAHFDELANTWGDAGNQSKRLESALARNDWTTIDEIAGKFGVTVNDGEAGRALLDQLDEQHKRNGEMLGLWRQGFINSTGPLMHEIHAEREGLDLAILKGNDIKKSYLHLYDAGAASKQGRIDALEAENKALRAKRGQGGADPESGGLGTSGGAWTRDRYAQSVASGEMDKKTPEERDRITQLMWESDARGRA